MAKRFRNKWGWYGAGTYLATVFLFGIFSVGAAFMASSSIKGLFFTAVVPFIIISLIINFLVGYGLGLLAEKIWRKIK